MRDETPPDPAEARAALQSVETMRRAGIRRGAPPRWFLAFGGLYVWALFAAQALEDPGIVTAALMLAMCVAVIVKRQTIRAWRRKFAGPAGAFLAALAAIATLGLFVTAKIAQERYGLLWAPPVAGAPAALILVAVSGWSGRWPTSAN